MISEIINNNWSISIGTAIITLFVSYIAKLFHFWFKSLRGAFSGKYICITFLGRDKFLIEAAHLKHYGLQLKGQIHGVLTLKKDSSGFVETANNGKYITKGFLEERVFILTYKSKVSRILNSGALVPESVT